MRSALTCRSVPSGTGEPHALHDVADVGGSPMGIAVDGAAHRPRGAGPGLEAGAAVRDCPAHQAVDRHAGIGADEIASDHVDPAAARTDDQTGHAAIGHEHVRSAAEHGDRHAVGMGRRGGRPPASRRRAAAISHSCRAADLEGRERCQRRIGVDGDARQGLGQRRRRSRSCAALLPPPASARVRAR